MKNKFKVILFIIVIFIIVILIGLTGCNNNSIEEPSQDIEDASHIRVDKLIKYKDSYVGDNGAVGNILSLLPASSFSEGFSLKTDKNPYEIVINYNPNKHLGIKEYNRFWNGKDPNEILEKNAMVFFSLIPNVEIISFNVDNIGEESYKYNRKDLPSLPPDEDSFKMFFDNK